MAWCGYDWANSGYTTLMITVFTVYVQRNVFSSEQSGITGAVVWAWTVAASMLIGAVLSPFVGAYADARAGKRAGLAWTASLGSLSCIGMALLPTDQQMGITGCFLIANVCLELSLTFYNGFLPEIAGADELNRVSALGMAWGYLGGGLALLLAMLWLQFGQHWGVEDAVLRLRLCILATGLWWFVFTVPTLLVLRDRSRALQKHSIRETSTQAIGQVLQTIREFGKHRTLLLFLIGFLFFNDGVQTVISQASTFAIHELKFSDQQLVAVVLMVQFIATPGALLIGWLADRTGRKTALVICLLAWIVLLISAWFVVSQTGYWVLSIGVALVLGGTQAVSRAVMGALTPPQQEARYFGFFNLSGKATSFMGTFFFGAIIYLTGSSRIAIVNLILFFLIGLWFVARLEIRESEKRNSVA